MQTKQLPADKRRRLVALIGESKIKELEDRLTGQAGAADAAGIEYKARRRPVLLVDMIRAKMENKEAPAPPPDITSFADYDRWQAQQAGQMAMVDDMATFAALAMNGGDVGVLADELAARLQARAGKSLADQVKEALARPGQPAQGFIKFPVMQQKRGIFRR